MGSSEFCILGNQSFLQNSTHANSTNVTYHLAPAGYATVNIPQLDLFITPSDGFSEMVANVTYITTTIVAKELGLTGWKISTNWYLFLSYKLMCFNYRDFHHWEKPYLQWTTDVLLALFRALKTPRQIWYLCMPTYYSLYKALVSSLGFLPTLKAHYWVLGESNAITFLITKAKLEYPYV